MLATVGAMSGALGRRLLYNLIYMLGLVALVLPFALWAPPIVRALAAALIWLGGSAYAAGRPGEQTDGWAIICAAVPVMVVAYGLADYVALARGQHASGISAAAAPGYADVVGFDFSDSVVQIKYATTYRSATRDRKSGRVSYFYYHIAPLTGSGWTPADPVPAWAGCGQQYIGLCDEWYRAYRGGVVAETSDRAGLRVAADQALAQHRLSEAPGAPLLRRVASVAQGQRQRAQVLLAAPLAAYLLWAIPIAIYALWECGAELWQSARA